MPGILYLAQGVELRRSTACACYSTPKKVSVIAGTPVVDLPLGTRTFEGPCRSCHVGFIGHVITSSSRKGGRKEGGGRPRRSVRRSVRPLDDIFCRLFSAPLDTRHATTTAAM